MRRLFLAGLVGVVVLSGGCCDLCPTTECGEECPDPAAHLTEDSAAPKVDIVIVPLPPNSVVVDDTTYDTFAETRRDLPDKGYFEIYVDSVKYEFNTRLGEDTAGRTKSEEAYDRPESMDAPGRLTKVFVVVGSKYVIGVYDDGIAARGEVICACQTCSNGATVCGCPPRCP